MLVYRIYDYTGKFIGQTVDPNESKAYMAVAKTCRCMPEDDPSEDGTSRLPAIQETPPTLSGDRLTQ